ncbi:hypothetical protein AQF52_6600 [Streptomyces venezuelae]|uniref:hypothetical protein n=1 Tax=Streptomyces gardneri TaxID=66892 RepID=UPI0006BC774F|nr:hypothetical protein [Streptomyces gardneri]ALO12193.1 hypothetical protein AQF52_6600 [Streptomyces venezuelae]QPK49014.1 hypothetical protein H4W23_33150 [Streptomyces gardneri]WRK40504.1 hypothetical protein U0M97_33305 [Streptomyces venezuelae]CUM37226.1 Pyoverdine biosynthesis related protein PvdP [Streptomyces venezuelae]
MIYDPLAGSWTYRSFVNRADLLPDLNPENIVKEDVDKWSRYLFGQGVMTFHPTVTGALTGLFEMGTAESPRDMRLNGKIEDRDGVTWIKWNAHGLPGTPSDGWLYEYDAYFTNKWPDGRRQIDAIVGSVVRSQPHDDLAPSQTTDRTAGAGSVASFVMVRPAFIEARDVISLPPELLEMLGSRHHRLHHAIWHGLRDNWATPSDGDISASDKAEIDGLGWAPPRPNQRPTRGTVDLRDPDNGAGEDFLYMHRQMIQKVRELLSGHGLPMIQAWTSIPSPNRKSGNRDGFSVPPAWDQGQGEAAFKGLATIKSDEYWQSRMTFLERKFKDPEYLATLSLDQLGAKVEWLIHNLMHIRWCSRPTDPKTLIPLPGGRPLTDTSEKWIKATRNDKPFYYDDLNDTFSSHVHPVFWRLHGWVDDRIEDWYAAHAAAHPGQVARKTVEAVSWFAKGPWVSVETPWVGPVATGHGPGGHAGDHEHGEHGHPGHDVAVMQQVYDLIFKPETTTAAVAASGTMTTHSVQFTAKIIGSGTP